MRKPIKIDPEILQAEMDRLFAGVSYYKQQARKSDICLREEFAEHGRRICNVLDLAIDKIRPVKGASSVDVLNGVNDEILHSQKPLVFNDDPFDEKHCRLIELVDKNYVAEKATGFMADHDQKQVAKQALLDVIEAGAIYFNALPINENRLNSVMMTHLVDKARAFIVEDRGRVVSVVQNFPFKKS